jgi:hypothetical protein
MMLFLISFFAGFALSASLIVAIGAQNLFVLRQGVDFHRELTREGYKFPLRIDPCLTLLRFQLTGALWRSDQHGFIERCASLASS